jgi:hypothetical protein
MVGTLDGIDITADVDAIHRIHEACLSALVEAENFRISAEVRELLLQPLDLRWLDRLEGRAPQTSGVPFDLCEQIRNGLLVCDLWSGRPDGARGAINARTCPCTFGSSGSAWSVRFLAASTTASMSL